MTECRHVIVTGSGMEISCAQDECPRCLSKRIAELEEACEKYKWTSAVNEELRDTLIELGAYVESDYPQFPETPTSKRIAELEALLSKQAEGDNNGMNEIYSLRCQIYGMSLRDDEMRNRIAELEAENAALKAENAQHDWWGGGGR